MMAPQHFPDACQSGVVRFLQQFLTLFFCIDFHAAELIDKEGTSSQTDTFLLVDSRTTANLDDQIAEQYQWGEKHQTESGDQYIEETFHIHP